MTTLHDKVLGALLGAACGEAMGNATRSMPREYLFDYYKGWVDTFQPIPDLFFDTVRPAGHISEGFSLALQITAVALENHGSIKEDTCDRAILRWLEDGRYSSMMDPCLYQRVSELTGGHYKQYPNMPILPHHATIFSTKHVFPAGLLAGGDFDRAVRMAIDLTNPTQPNSATLSASCAMAAAINEAMNKQTDVFQIVNAAIRGARVGFNAGTECPVPLVDNYIKLAVWLARNTHGTEDDFLYELRDHVGAGNEAYQALPSAFGILVYTNADACRAIRLAVNLGGESDAVAAFVGAVAGTLNGAGAFPADYLTLIDEVNGTDLRLTADKIADTIAQGPHKNL